MLAASFTGWFSSCHYRESRRLPLKSYQKKPHPFAFLDKHTLAMALKHQSKAIRKATLGKHNSQHIDNWVCRQTCTPTNAIKVLYIHVHTIYGTLGRV